MIVNGALIGFDILWLTTTASHWGDEFPNAPVWNATQGLRSIVVFLSIVNIAIKVKLTVRENNDVRLLLLLSSSCLKEPWPTTLVHQYKY
jgi:hypothetical protein